jgi:hypothetical protein
LLDNDDNDVILQSTIIWSSPQQQINRFHMAAHVPLAMQVCVILVCHAAPTGKHPKNQLGMQEITKQK